MHFRNTAHEPQAAGGTDALLRLQQIDNGSAPDEEDPLDQMSSLYQRAVEFVRGEFEERTWQMFWQTVIESRASSDVAANMNVPPAAIRKAKSRMLRRLKEEVGDVVL